MKYILLFSLILFGCSPELKVGDCYGSKTMEGTFKVFKVLKVGQYGYESIADDGSIYTTSNKRAYDNREDCFDLFDKLKGEKKCL